MENIWNEMLNAAKAVFNARKILVLNYRINLDFYFSHDIKNAETFLYT